MEYVNSFGFVGISTEKLSWSLHISTLVNTAQKQLYFLRKLTAEKFPCQVLANFYRRALESLLNGTIRIGMVCPWPRAGGLCSGSLKLLRTSPEYHLYWYGKGPRAQRILKDNTDHSNSLFTLLPLGKWNRSIQCCTTYQLQSSFFPLTVRLLNSSAWKKIFLCSIRGRSSAFHCAICVAESTNVEHSMFCCSYWVGVWYKWYHYNMTVAESVCHVLQQ